MSDLPKFSLLQRTSGYWYILYRDESRIRWKSTRTRSKQEALKALTHLKDLLRPKPKVSLFSDFVTDFLAFAGGTFSAKTKVIYASALRRLESLVGNLPLKSLTPKHLDLYKVERLKTISPVSVNIEIRTLRAALNTAVRWELIDRNPFRDSPLLMVPERAPSHFSREDFQKLFSLIDEGWLKELVIFAVLTGMRRGEIVNLRWSEVDLQRKLIHVQSGPTFRTKHGKRRVVPVSDAVFHLLSAKPRKSSSDFVFTLNGRKIKEDWPTQKLKYYVYAAHLNDDHLHFQSLRHTFATWLVQSGTSLYEVQKLLGHSSIAVTEVYSHLLPQHLHDTVNKIELPLTLEGNER